MAKYIFPLIGGPWGALGAYLYDKHQKKKKEEKKMLKQAKPQLKLPQPTPSFDDDLDDLGFVDFTPEMMDNIRETIPPPPTPKRDIKPKTSDFDFDNLNDEDLMMLLAQLKGSGRMRGYAEGGKKICGRKKTLRGKGKIGDLFKRLIKYLSKRKNQNSNNNYNVNVDDDDDIVSKTAKLFPTPKFGILTDNTRFSNDN